MRTNESSRDKVPARHESTASGDTDSGQKTETDNDPVTGGGQVCQHAKCDDPATEDIPLEGDITAHLCEDHAHMRLDGTPVEGHEPNDPTKFSDSGPDHDVPVEEQLTERQRELVGRDGDGE